MRYRLVRSIVSLKLVPLVLVLWASGAFAVTTSIINPNDPSAPTNTNTTGTGFGAILDVLSLQQPGGPTNTAAETGAWVWNGTTTVATGDAFLPASGQDPTAADLLAAGFLADGSNFDIVFQVNQTGQTTIDLTSFGLNFYSPTGALLFQALYTDASDSTDALPGVGVGTSGYLFDVQLSLADALLFFGDPNNRVGGFIPDGGTANANDGPDNFWIVASNPVSPVPEPGSLLLLGSGLVGFGAWRRRSKRS